MVFHSRGCHGVVLFFGVMGWFGNIVISKGKLCPHSLYKNPI